MILIWIIGAIGFAIFLKLSYEGKVENEINNVTKVFLTSVWFIVVPIIIIIMTLIHDSQKQ